MKLCWLVHEALIFINSEKICHSGSQQMFFVLSMYIPEATVGPRSNSVVSLDPQSTLETEY